MGGENGYDRMSGDEEIGEEKLAQNIRVDKNDHDMNLKLIPMMDMNQVKCQLMAMEKILYVYFSFGLFIKEKKILFIRIKQVIITMKWMKKNQVVYERV